MEMSFTGKIICYVCCNPSTIRSNHYSESLEKESRCQPEFPNKLLVRDNEVLYAKVQKTDSQQRDSDPGAVTTARKAPQ